MKPESNELINAALSVALYTSAWIETTVIAGWKSSTHGRALHERVD